MSWCDDEVGEELSAALGVAVRLRRARSPVPAKMLTSGERAQWHALPQGSRRRNWLLGRAALKALLATTADTSVLSFPHPYLSLTHAGDQAVAVAVDHDGDGGDDHAVTGTGVDHEPWRATDPRMARFFLRPEEQPTQLGLLRAWTIKEALFKAVPTNHRVTLRDVELDDANAPTGTATGPAGERLRYTVIDTADGPLAVAVCGEGCRAVV
jgi:phosphopantetheinyl transferase (holo-ACP synthase)